MKWMLLVDDDPVTHLFVKSAAQSEIEVKGCSSIAEAMRVLEKEDLPDIVIIDRMLPDGDGLEICSRMKSEERLKSIPIVFLSSKDAEVDKVSGLFAGADDYLVKPLGPLEFKARIHARLRTLNARISVGEVILDLESHRAFVCRKGEQKVLDLTRIEFKIFVTFAQAPDRIYSRGALLTKVWSENVSLSDRVVDTHISNLRQKISGAGLVIEAVRGEGYRLLVQKAVPHAS